MDQLHALAEFLMKYEKIDGDLFAEVMSGVISFGEAAERTEQELTSAREKAEPSPPAEGGSAEGRRGKEGPAGLLGGPFGFPPAP